MGHGGRVSRIENRDTEHVIPIEMHFVPAPYVPDQSKVPNHLHRALVDGIIDCDGRLVGLELEQVQLGQRHLDRNVRTCA